MDRLLLTHEIAFFNHLVLVLMGISIVVVVVFIRKQFVVVISMGICIVIVGLFVLVVIMVLVFLVFSGKGGNIMFVVCGVLMPADVLVFVACSRSCGAGTVFMVVMMFGVSGN